MVADLRRQTDQYPAGSEKRKQLLTEAVLSDRDAVDSARKATDAAIGTPDRVRPA